MQAVGGEISEIRAEVRRSDCGIVAAAIKRLCTSIINTKLIFNLNRGRKKGDTPLFVSKLEIKQFLHCMGAEHENASVACTENVDFDRV